jgi:hypothetical protein
MLKLLAIHRQFAGVKHMHAEIDEGYKQEQVQRRHYMCANQRCEFAQTENPGNKHN